MDYKQLKQQMAKQAAARKKVMLQLRKAGLSDERIGLRYGISRQRVHYILGRK